MSRRILRMPDVQGMIGLSRSTLYAMLADDEDPFPRPIKLGKRAIGWDSSAIEEWIEMKIKEAA